jgi:hypothetical protein
VDPFSLTQWCASATGRNFGLKATRECVMRSGRLQCTWPRICVPPPRRPVC